MNIELYTRGACQLCDQTKAALKKSNLAFEERIIERDITRDEVLEKFPGARMLPIVVVDGTWIGGRDEILRLVAQRKQDEQRSTD
jgi:glutaredoxin